ncbi:MAG TPA: SIMPL domain-containing protein, partial [Terracidiphilus sp.]|jgi:uncharacterized protein YggE
MFIKQAMVAFALVIGCAAVGAQSANQIQLKIEPSNRTLTASAEAQVTADPDIAILHIGFETPPSDAKTAYAAGAKISNEIITAIKQTGIAETSIHSESQNLESVGYRSHKFKLAQQWTVKTPPERVAEILDVAVSAGATDSGQIDWTVKDEKALEDQALDKAAARARENATVLAKGMGVHLGALIYVTNQVSEQISAQYGLANFSNGVMAMDRAAPAAPPLAIEPHKVTRVATVYAVFAIE